MFSFNLQLCVIIVFKKIDNVIWFLTFLFHWFRYYIISDKCQYSDKNVKRTTCKKWIIIKYLQLLNISFLEKILPFRVIIKCLFIVLDIIMKLNTFRFHARTAKNVNCSKPYAYIRILLFYFYSLLEVFSILNLNISKQMFWFNFKLLFY